MPSAGAAWGPRSPLESCIVLDMPDRDCLVGCSGSTHLTVLVDGGDGSDDVVLRRAPCDCAPAMPPPPDAVAEPEAVESVP